MLYCTQIAQTGIRNVGVIGILRAYPGAPFTWQTFAILDYRAVQIYFLNDGFILPLIFGRGLCLLARLFHCDFIRITQNWLWLVSTARWQSESAILATRFGTRYAQWWSNICMSVLMWSIFNFRYPLSSRGDSHQLGDAFSLPCSWWNQKKVKNILLEIDSDCLMIRLVDDGGCPRQPSGLYHSVLHAGHWELYFTMTGFHHTC